MKSEKAIQNEILMRITRMDGAMFWREQSARAWVGRVVERKGSLVTLSHAMPIIAGVPGIADIMGVVGGRSVALEVKTDTGSQEESQMFFEKKFRQSGGTYAIVRSADEAVEFLHQSVRGIRS